MFINLHIVNNDDMKILYLENKLLNLILFPLLAGSFILLACELCELVNLYFPSQITDNAYLLSETLYSAIGYIFCYLIVFQSVNGKRGVKALYSLICIALFRCAFSSVSDIECSYLLPLIFGLISALIFNKADKLISYPSLIIIAIAFGYAFGYVTDATQGWLLNICNKFFNGNIISSAFFGGAETIFSLFDSKIFSDMFYYKSIGGSLLLDDELVTGVKDLFSNGYTGTLVSSFLSGKYYFLFALSGLAFAVSNELKGIQKNALIVIIGLTLLSGNTSMLLLFLLCENIFILLPIILISALSYICAVLLKLGMGFLGNGGMIELVLSINGRWLYLICGSAVICALGYFCGKYFVEKSGISDCYNYYIPTRFNALIKALGGIENIIRIKEDKAEVRNPQLVDAISGDYELKENIVICKSTLISELGEYLE